MKARKNPEPKPLFLERMKKLLPDKKDYQKYLDILKVQPVKSFRCNKLKISPKELKEKLEKNYNWEIIQPWKNYPEVMIAEGKFSDNDSPEISQVKNDDFTTGSAKLFTKNKINKKNLSTNKYSAKKYGESYFEAINSEQSESKLAELEPGELGRALEHLLGYYYIQELASMLPVIALKPKPHETILDLCSAPGSKTTQIASEMKNTGSIIANEVSIGRIKILSSNLERCGVTNTIITRRDGIALCKKLRQEGFSFNKILVDAPCSGEGTLRSSPKTYVMWNPKTITSLSKLQKQLFRRAFEILKVGGEIIYSTCTHAPEENEAIANWALKEFSDQIQIEEINLPIKPREGLTNWEPPRLEDNKNKKISRAIGAGRSLGGKENLERNLATVNEEKYLKEVKKCARVYPHDNNTEGFFLVKFRRVK